MEKSIVEPLRLGRKKANPTVETFETPLDAKLLWELMEMEAPLKFYIDDKEHPAFLLFPRWHWAASKSYHHLYMHTIGLINKFSTEKKALERLREIIENANFPVKVYRVCKYGRHRGERVLFAENTVQRMELTEYPTKVFNVEEWTQKGA